MDETNTTKQAPAIGEIVKDGYLKPQGLTPEQDPFDIDTTGWVVTRKGYARLTADGVLCEVYHESDPGSGSWHWTARVAGIDTAFGDLECCLYHASIPANTAGWAEQDHLAALIATNDKLLALLDKIKETCEGSAYQIWTRDWGNDDVVSIDLILSLLAEREAEAAS